MENCARSEKSQDECCDPRQGEGGGGHFGCQSTIMNAPLLSALGLISCSDLGRPLPFWDRLT